FGVSCARRSSSSFSAGSLGELGREARAADAIGANAMKPTEDSMVSSLMRRGMASTVEERLKEVAAVGQEIPESGISYHDGKLLPLADAKVSIATHALQYGTGVFEGIRAYWNPAHEQLYVFRLHEHFERMA